MYDSNKPEHVLFLYQLFVPELYRIRLNVNDHNVDQMKNVDRNLMNKFKCFFFFLVVG
jgi:hypothetical protein